MSKETRIETKIKTTRPSVNYAKDWLDQLLLIPGLVLSGREKGIAYGSDHYGAINNHFTVYWAIFGMVTNKHPNTEPVDPRASELLTSEKAVFCNGVFSVVLCSPFCEICSHSLAQILLLSSFDKLGLKRRIIYYHQG